MKAKETCLSFFFWVGLCCFVSGRLWPVSDQGRQQNVEKHQPIKPGSFCCKVIWVMVGGGGSLIHRLVPNNYLSKYSSECGVDTII